MRRAIAIELGCLGNSKNPVWVRSSIMGFSVQCGVPVNEVAFPQFHEGAVENFLIGGNTANVEFPVGQRITVRVTAPAGDIWQLWITGGTAS